LVPVLGECEGFISRGPMEGAGSGRASSGGLAVGGVRVDGRRLKRGPTHFKKPDE